VKHWKASVEESCDVEFFCCMITRHAHTSGVAMYATNHFPVHHLLDPALTSVCSHYWKNICVAQNFSSDHSIIAASVEDCPGARIARWTLQHRSYRNNGIRALKLWRLRRKINCSQLLCHVSLYMRPETFWTTLIIMFFSGIYYFSIFPLCVYRRQFWRGIVLAAVCLSVSVCEQDN